MKLIQGFSYVDQFSPHNEERIIFIENQGRDISFNRWRFSLYYAPHLAITHFESSQEDADTFYNKNNPLCYSESEFIEYSKTIRNLP